VDRSGEEHRSLLGANPLATYAEQSTCRATTDVALGIVPRKDRAEATARPLGVAPCIDHPDASASSPVVGEQFRLADIGGGLAHRELPAAADLAAPTALQHVPIDSAGRRHVLVADLVGDVVLVGAGREQ
jgi:hypothetical protein